MYIHIPYVFAKCKEREKQKESEKKKTIIVGTLLYIRRLNVLCGVFFAFVQKMQNAAFFSGRKRHLSLVNLVRSLDFLKDERSRRTREEIAKKQPYA